MMCSWYSSVLYCVVLYWGGMRWHFCNMYADFIETVFGSWKKPIENIDSKVDTSKPAFNSFDGKKMI